MENRLMSAFEKTGYVIGPFMKLNSPTAVELAGLAGFDFVILDAEHGPLNILVIEDLIRAAHLRNLCAIVRVGNNDPLMISRALDVGADGVQVPQITTAEDAKRAVKTAKFFPEGERGVCRYVRAAEYTNISKQDYFKAANKNTSVIVHIEGKEGLKNLNAILDVDGIDVLFIGPYDLSQSLGIPGETDHPILKKEVDRIIRDASKKGKAIGIFVENPEDAKNYIARGIQYISYSVDVGLILDQFKNVVSQIKETNT